MGSVVATHAIRRFTGIRRSGCFKGRDADQLIPECVVYDLSQDY